MVAIKESTLMAPGSERIDLEREKGEACAATSSAASQRGAALASPTPVAEATPGPQRQPEPPCRQR